jgi:membrane protease YdiL (CAAX protease family)
MADVVEQNEQKPADRQSALAIEALVVVLFFYSASFFGQFVTVYHASDGALAPLIRVVGETGELAPLFLIVWVADRNLRCLGFKQPVWKWDIPLAALLTGFMFLSHWALRPLSHNLHWSLPSHRSAMASSLDANNVLWLSLPAIILSVVLQEALFRGYFVGRLRTLTGNAWLPVLVSAVLFGIWHLYQGPSGAAATFLDGLALAICFARTQRIWPMIVAHFLFNMHAYYDYSRYLHDLWGR